MYYDENEDAFKGVPKTSRDSYVRYDSNKTGHSPMIETVGDKITVVSAIQDTTLQAEKLFEMVLMLLQRLEPIRSNVVVVPETLREASMLKNAELEYNSQMAEQISTISDLIKRSQSSIARAMSDLDL